MVESNVKKIPLNRETYGQIMFLIKEEVVEHLMLTEEGERYAGGVDPHHRRGLKYSVVIHDSENGPLKGALSFLAGGPHLAVRSVHDDDSRCIHPEHLPEDETHWTCILKEGITVPVYEEHRKTVDRKPAAVAVNDQHVKLLEQYDLVYGAPPIAFKARDLLQHKTRPNLHAVFIREITDKDRAHPTAASFISFPDDIFIGRLSDGIIQYEAVEGKFWKLCVPTTVQKVTH